MFGLNIESLVQKYLIKLLERKALKQGVPLESVSVMFQTDPRTKNKTLLFTSWKVENINNWEHKEWIKKEEILKLLKE